MISSPPPVSTLRRIVGSALARIPGVSALSSMSVDAVDQTGKRRVGSGRVSSRDVEVPDKKRATLASTAREVETNFSVAGWALRKHLDFTASHSFHSTTQNDAVDKAVERFVAKWSRAEEFDIAGRHCLGTMQRLIEGNATSIGDCLVVKLASGRIQVIEGDRIKTPKGGHEERGSGLRVVNGVKIDAAGRAIAYAVHKRDGSRLAFERWVPARNAILHGAFDRIDQVRGVSPIVSALAPLEDVYEGFTYALAKMKVSRLFGLKLKRSGSTRIPRADGEEEDENEIEIKFGNQPLVLDLDSDTNEDADFIESKTPAVEFQQFCNMMIGVALKALDIPFSFFDEAHTNFFGSRAALLLYLKSCEAKRARVRSTLNHLTEWRLALAVLNGELKLPAGWSIADLKWDWVASGLPWWDPSKEIKADVAAIAAGLRTRREIRRERYGDDWFEVARQLKEEEEFLEEIKLNTVAPGPGVFNPEPVAQGVNE